MIDFGNGPSTSNILIVASNGGSCKPEFDLYNGSTGLGGVGDPSAVSTNQWVFLTGVANGTQILFYVNGNLVGTSTLSAALVPSTRTINYIGRSNWSSDSYFNGYIEDVQIYSRALSAAEVSTLYSRGTVQ
jgi:hypothetical protein